MGERERKDSWHAALASGSRRSVLELLARSDVPLDAAAIAEGTGQHVTTARFHLEQLEAAGLLRRETEHAGQRGRPRILFSTHPSARTDDAQRKLSATLAGALAEDLDGGKARAIRAGEAWSADYAGDLQALPGTGIAPLVRILDKLGFDPVPSADTHRIDLHSCPFRDEARRNPDVVCSVHLGLIRGAARALGHDAAQTDLLPFVQPELCVVALHRDWRVEESASGE